MAISEGQVTANGMTFAYLEDGPSTGPLALCLHGFPDSAWTFQHLLPALAGEGYHAVAPFMRGYAPSDIPADGIYTVATLAADACALHEALGGDDRALLVGHDWGAMAVYVASVRDPGRWRRLVIAAIPPDPGFARAFLTYEQLKRSWYSFFFQHPLADFVLQMDEIGFIDRLWSDWSPGFDGEEYVEKAKLALRGHPRVQAALGYYRALLSLEGAAGDPPRGAPPQPALYLHGDRDGCIGVEAVAGAEDYFAPGSRVEIIKNAGHFAHLEHPDQVTSLILDFTRQR